MSKYIYATSDDEPEIVDTPEQFADSDDYPTEDADRERDFERNNTDY